MSRKSTGYPEARRSSFLFEGGRTGLLAPQRRGVLPQADAREPVPEPAPQGNIVTLGANRIAEDVAHLFLHTPPMTIGPALEPCLHVLFEVSHDELSHVQAYLR